MRTIDIIEKELQKFINNHVDLPPDDCGDNKIKPMTFYFLSMHPKCRYKVTLELVEIKEIE
jgi:hypothetical protein